MNDCPWMRKDLKYELDIVALGKYVCACEERWWKKMWCPFLVDQCQIHKFAKFHFDLDVFFIRFDPLNANSIIPVESRRKLFQMHLKVKRQNKLLIFAYQRLYLLSLTESRQNLDFTSIHHFHDLQSFIWLNKRYNHIQLREIINAIELSVNSKILLECSSTCRFAARGIH